MTNARDPAAAAQNAHPRAATALIGIQPAPAQIGGYCTRLRLRDHRDVPAQNEPYRADQELL